MASPTEHLRSKLQVELHLTDWSSRTGIPLIAGHTHRPTQPGLPLAVTPAHNTDDDCGCDYEQIRSEYYNSGSCVHPHGITAIEIIGGVATLVKWAVEAEEDGTMKLARQVVAAD